MPFWWFDRKTGGMSATKIDEIGVVGIYERWMDALENNHPKILGVRPQCGQPSVNLGAY